MKFFGLSINQQSCNEVKLDEPVTLMRPAMPGMLQAGAMPQTTKAKAQKSAGLNSAEWAHAKHLLK